MELFQLFVPIFLMANVTEVIARSPGPWPNTERKELKVPRKITLNDGNTIPIVEFGTYGVIRLNYWDDIIANVLKFATWNLASYTYFEFIGIRVADIVRYDGYNYIDLAAPASSSTEKFYFEYGVRHGLNELLYGKNRIPRDQLYLTQQFPIDQPHDNVVKYLKEYVQTAWKTEQNLHLYDPLGFVNLYLLPMKLHGNYRNTDDYLLAWQGMEEAKRLGLTKSIGVAYFTDDQLKKLHAASSIKPAIHLRDLPTAPNYKDVFNPLFPNPLDKLSVTCGSSAPVYFLPIGTYGRQGLFLDYDYKFMYSSLMDGLLSSGFKNFDTSSELDMEVEEIFGERISKTLVLRSQLTILTRLWNTHYKKEEVILALMEALKRLKMTYVDYFIVNSPGKIDADGSKDRDYIETWKGMLEVQRLNLTTHIGLANFEPEHLERLNESFPGINPCILRNPPLRNWLQERQKIYEFHDSLDIKIMTYNKMSSMADTSTTWNEARSIYSRLSNFSGRGEYYGDGYFGHYKYDRIPLWLMTAWDPGFVVQVDY